MKRLTALVLALLLVLSLTACVSTKPETDLANAEWDQIVADARGTTVTFYGWGGDENRNNWLNTTVASYVKENYDVTLEVVGMNIDDILTKLSGEIQLTQYEELRTLPVVATEKLNEAEKAAFDAVDLGQGILSHAELLDHRLPEMPASLVPIIEQIWLAEIVGK